jgi:hypothetical protein
MTRLGRGAAMLVVAVGALLLAAVAAADREQVHLTKAGQAAARAAVLRRADLGTSASWSGGAKTPSLTGEFPCASYHPRQSDLVLIGDAETMWRATGLAFDSEAQVLQTPAMVRLDWRRTVLAPQVFPCLRTVVAKQFSGAGNRLVSFARIPFPQIAPFARAYRAVAEIRTPSATVLVLVDVVLVGRGRTEITLTTSAPLLARASVAAAEVRVARLLLSRARVY